MSPRLAPRSAAHGLRLLRPPPEAETTTRARVIAAQQGDERALRALYDAHVQALAGLCLRLLRNHADAEEVVQDAFVSAFAKLGELREPERFRPWLNTIAVRLVQRKRRKERLLAFLGFATAHTIPLDALAAPASPEEARSQLRALDVALGTLPERQRLAWMLRHVEDEPLESVAAACSCSLATVKRWLVAAEIHLARAFEPEAVRDESCPPSTRRARA